MRVASQRGIRGCGAATDDDGDGLVGVERIAVARGERRVVGEDGAGADDDGIGCGAATVHVGTGVGAGDPLTRAVGCCGAAVQALRPLHGHMRAAEALCVQPVADESLCGILLLTRDHVDTGGAHALRPAAGNRAGVVECIDDAGDAGVDEGEGAGARAAGVITRLEGDDGRRAAALLGRELGERIDLGVRCARAAVPAFGEGLARGGEDDGPDLRVYSARSVGRERESARHGVSLCVVHCHPWSFVEAPGMVERARARPVLPLIRTSELLLTSPSVPDFHRIGA